MKIHILMNNYVTASKLLAEHGLSFFIETENEQIIFDTGQSDAFIHNAKILGKDLSNAQAIILSHGHYDHSGGLKSLIELNRKSNIYIHPCAFNEKYSLRNDTLHYAGIPFDLEDIGANKDRIKFNTKASYIFDDILISGEVHKSNDFEQIPKTLMVKENDELKQDNMIDEQFLIIREQRGIIIVLGCSHPGVINCIEHACNLVPNQKILAVIGGMHLKGASKERVDKTIDCLKSKDIEKIIPLHCTGFEAISEMKNVFKNKCIIGTVGDIIDIK